MSAGPPILNSPASKESEYAHALVHRKEGGHLGELGMVGWDNACYWFGRTSYHDNFPEVRELIFIYFILLHQRSEQFDLNKSRIAIS